MAVYGVVGLTPRLSVAGRCAEARWQATRPMTTPKATDLISAIQ